MLIFVPRNELAVLKLLRSARLPIVGKEMTLPEGSELRDFQWLWSGARGLEVSTSLEKVTVIVTRLSIQISLTDCPRNVQVILETITARLQ
jgi:hypothetical protein